MVDVAYFPYVDPNPLVRNIKNFIRSESDEAGFRKIEYENGAFVVYLYEGLEHLAPIIVKHIKSNIPDIKVTIDEKNKYIVRIFINDNIKIIDKLVIITLTCREFFDNMPSWAYRIFKKDKDMQYEKYGYTTHRGLAIAMYGKKFRVNEKIDRIISEREKDSIKRFESQLWSNKSYKDYNIEEDKTN